MRKKKPFRTFLITASALFISFATAAFIKQTTKSASADSGDVIKVAYFESKNFQEGTDDSGIKSGYAYEIYQKISDYTGWNYEYVYGDWTTLYHSFLNGNIDLFAGLTYTPDRYTLMEFADHEIDTESVSVFVNKNNALFTNDNITQLNGKTVGVLEDSGIASSFYDWCMSKSLNPEIVKYNRMDDLLLELNAGNIDAFISPDTLVSIDSDARIFTTFAERSFYFCATRGATELVDSLKKSLDTIEKEEPDFLPQLRRKYFSDSIKNASLTEDELAWIERHQNLNIGYEMDYLPFSDKGEDGNPTGVVTDIVDAWLDGLKLKDKVNIVYKGYKDYDEMFFALQNGYVDTVFPIVNDMWFAEQKGIMCATNLVSSSIVAIYKDTFNEKSLESISYSSHSAIQEICANIYYPDAKKIVCSSRDECLDAVKSGMAGCTLFNSTRAEMAVREAAYKDLSIMPLGKTVDYSFAVRKGDRVLLSMLNKGIATINTSTFTNKLFNFVDLSTSYTFKDFLKDNMVLITVLILLIASAFFIMQVVHSRKLTKAFNEVKKANEVKTNFFFNMSHDIRTPMNAILGFTNMGLKYIDDKEKVTECLTKAQQSGGLLLSLINNVLDISRIESNKVVAEQNPGDVYLSFSTIENTMKELASTKNIEVTFEVSDIQDRYVYADFNKCIRIFTNLISNAIKYNNEGGKVHASCKQIGGNVNGYGIYQFVIEDNGFGMSEEFQQHMFESFSREKNDNISKIEGNGLGLSVCKTYTEFLNGKLECESKVGVGTKFIITLPLKIQEGQDYTDPLTGEVVCADEKKEEDELVDLTNKKVLVVDDNPLNLEIARDTLEEVGLIVETANDGTVAVNALKEKGPNHFDFILMDIQMPIMNGFEASKAIREMYPNDKIIIIALSANAFTEDKEASIAAGMNDHVAKPIEKKSLFRVVSKYLK